jgi:hypothetical protein
MLTCGRRDSISNDFVSTPRAVQDRLLSMIRRRLSASDQVQQAVRRDRK